MIDTQVSLSSEFCDSKLRIGNNVKINQNVSIDFSGNLNIDDNALISKNVTIYTHSHGYNPRSKPVKKPLTIHRDVWIGSNVIITENVDFIGANSIIAAGSVVTKNVENNILAGGNPAKIIKYLP